jgi:tRNA/rRNA methyltransferase
MNLGQAVAVCLYELTRSGFEDQINLPVLHEAPATEQDRERLTELLLEVMQSTGYTRRYPHNAAAPFVRRLVQQLGRTHREAMTWMGILRQIIFRASEEPPQ